MAIRCTYTKHPDAHNIGVVRHVEMPTGFVYVDQKHADMRLGMPGLQVRCVSSQGVSGAPRVFQNGDGTIELTEAPDA